MLYFIHKNAYEYLNDNSNRYYNIVKAMPSHLSLITKFY